jgi:DNA replication protein DnaC
LQKNDIENFLHVEKIPRIENCLVHGKFFSKNVLGSIWTNCPVCCCAADSDEDRKNAEEVRQLWQRKLGMSGIPARFKSRTLESYSAKSEGQLRALTFAIAYADGFEVVRKTGRCAIFCGKPGTGKTHLAAGIALQVMRHGSVLFTTVQRMMRRVKDAWRKGSEESESDVIRLLVKPDLLIIDEIGVQVGSEFEKNMMFDILNERYENSLPTLLLSNLTVAEIKIFLGERVFDRLKEDEGECLVFDWQSHRGCS